MENYEKLGIFYLGKYVDSKTGNVTKDPLLYDSKDLTTHAVCLGMTGSGKTGFGMVLLEEASIDGIPSLVIDPKGDLSNLLLTFTDLTPEEFTPWIDSQEAEKNGMNVKKYSQAVAKKWKEGLKEWNQDGKRVEKYQNAVEKVIYTPASNAGIPISVLSSFKAPPKELLVDAGALRDRILTTTSSLLGLLGLDVDPIKSREHILISTLIDKSWQKGLDIDLPTLIQQIQKPPFNKIGVLDLDTFFPAKDRLALSINLNNLLASPGFQAWMEGVPLNIQDLLYTSEGKPKMSILSIAHLSDGERMFFVTLLLNELITWMRRQPGTSSLRALLYMDEIFGYFPPTANPPSKIPMITLLKQARAFGVGVVLATQNPVDLDYKGLANCGSWFIGKLQTERDKARVIEGLKSQSSKEINTTSFNKMMALTGKQIFIMHSIYEKEPVLFKTRWALSYLHGPLTLPQIAKLMENVRTQKEEEATPLETVPTSKGASSKKPVIPGEITEYFVNRQINPQNVQYRPLVLGMAKLHFVDAKNKIDTWQNISIAAPTSEDGKTVLWDQGEVLSDIKNQLSDAPWPNATYLEIPAGLLQEKNYTSFEKSLTTYLYQNQTYSKFYAPEVKMTSNANETEADFRSRISISQREKRDAVVKKLRDSYGTKIASLQQKIRLAQDKLEREKQQAGQRKLETYISVGATLIGTLFGRGMTKGTITQAGSSMKGMGKIQKEQQEIQIAEDNVQVYQTQLENIEDELDKEVSKVSTGFDAAEINLEKEEIRPRKGDISIDEIALIWWPNQNEA